jgi:hypoxanthine phosphoribosyltransferase
MSQNPYDYSTRQGIRPISWNDFHALCKGLAQAVSPYNPEIVLAVGRGGFYPGTLISHILQVEIYPVRLTRRVNDVVTYNNPQWRVKPPELVKAQRVLVVDEICGVGETLQMVKEETLRLGASEVRSAVMYAHTWGTGIPDYIGLITDELLLNPWDREIFKDGEFQFHPEYVNALALQGIQADSSLLIPTEPLFAAKS